MDYFYFDELSELTPEQFEYLKKRLKSLKQIDKMETYIPKHFKEIPLTLLQRLIEAKVYPFVARHLGVKYLFYLVTKDEKIIGTSVHHCEQKETTRLGFGLVVVSIILSDGYLNTNFMMSTKSIQP